MGKVVSEICRIIIVWKPFVEDHGNTGLKYGNLDVCLRQLSIFRYFLFFVAQKEI